MPLAFTMAPVGAQSQAAQKPVVNAQGPADEELKLPQLLEKIFRVYGSKEALLGQEMNWISQGQTKVLDAQPPAMRLFRQTRKGKKLRIDEELPGETPDKTTPSMTVFDGALSWNVTGGKVTEPADESNKLLCEDSFRLPSVLAHGGDPAYKLSLLGRTRYRGQPVYAIQAEVPGQTPTTVFVDETTYLVRATTYQRSTTGAPTTVFDEFSDYKPLGVGMVPYKVMQFIAGKPMYEIDLDSVTAGSAISDAEFKRPGQPTYTHLAQPIAVPFEFFKQEIVVKVRINGGEPLDFLLDTGASDTIIDRRTAAENYLDQKGDLKIVTAAGTVSMPASKVNKLEVGSLALADVPVLILDLSPQTASLGKPIAGIIGASALSQFAVTLDFVKHAITFQEPDTYLPPRGATSVPLEKRRGPVVRALLNGKDEQAFLVDTGSAVNHLTETMSKPYVSGPASGLTEASGLDQQSVKLGTVVLQSVQLGQQKQQQVSFTYPYHQQAQSDRSGFFATADIGVLGNPFWRNFLMTLDYRSQKLVLLPNRTERTGQELSDLITTGDTKTVAFRDFRAAEVVYQKALTQSRAAHDTRNEARVLGRLGNLHRLMTKDLHRPEQSQLAFDYFTHASELARKLDDKELQGRILADWSLLYSDNGQQYEAMQSIEQAILLAPGDPQVNVDYAIHLYRHGQISGMKQYVERALSLDPSSWQALWYQVRLGELLSDNQRQKAALKDILRFYPWSKLAAEKLAALSKATPPEKPVKVTSQSGTPAKP